MSERAEHGERARRWPGRPPSSRSRLGRPTQGRRTGPGRSCKNPPTPRKTRSTDRPSGALQGAHVTAGPSRARRSPSSMLPPPHRRPQHPLPPQVTNQVHKAHSAFRAGRPGPRDRSGHTEEGTCHTSPARHSRFHPRSPSDPPPAHRRPPAHCATGPTEAAPRPSPAPQAGHAHRAGRTHRPSSSPPGQATRDDLPSGRRRRRPRPLRLEMLRRRTDVPAASTVPLHAPTGPRASPPTGTGRPQPPLRPSPLLLTDGPFGSVGLVRPRG